MRDSAHVGGRRVVSTRSGEVRVSAGSRFSLSGAISGVSSLSWQKDGRTLPTDNRYVVKRSGSGSSQLTVRDFRASDAGMYTLSGSNDAGSASSAVQITSAGMNK